MDDSSSMTRVHIARQFALHVGRRDVAQALPLLSSEVSYRVLGDHSLAGTFIGPDAVASHLIYLADRTMGTFDTLKWVDWLVGEDHVAALAEVHMQADERIFHGRPLFLMKFDINDRISEITIFFESEADALWFFGRDSPPEGLTGSG